MSRFEIVFEELKLIVNSPKIYLANFLDDIRCQIDIECQMYLNKPGLAIKNNSLAVEQQQQLIYEVDILEQKCLLNLKTIPAVQTNLEALESRLKCLDSNDKDAASKLEKDIYSAMYTNQKILFMGKGIIFFNLDNYKKFLQFRSYTRQQILFGLLFLIEDEFLLFNHKFQQILE